MAKKNIQDNTSILSVLKRKSNSAGLRLIVKLEKTFKQWPEKSCLITGAPRSGTTAMENWLNDQKRVVAFHETRVLRTTHRFLEEAKLHSKLKTDGEFLDLARNIAYQFYSKRCIMSENEIFIDKEPLMSISFPEKDYSSFLDNYRLMFPHGKLLFMVRHPLSTIWSMNERKWGYTLRNYTPRSFELDYYIESWCDCAQLILDYADEKNTYICSFETLVNQPGDESKRILDFLGISDGKPFQPKEVKTIGFTDEETAHILQKTKNYMHSLNERGISLTGKSISPVASH
ncbi:hypothetical protein BH23BAC3_BH23BAC3_32960 [soil metagenome]